MVPLRPGAAELARRGLLECLRVVALVLLVALGWAAVVAVTVAVTRTWPGTEWQ